MAEKTCAYCGGHSPLTREHIWPSGFLRRQNFDLKFSARANKTFRADLVIADVCARCNNGPLSDLDSHACELYDRRFAKPVGAAEVVPFTYDYGLLMRWLLKVSYNASRATREYSNVLARYRETILSRDPCSPVWAVAKLATIRPSDTLNPETGERKRLYPEGVAWCGPIVLPGIDIGEEAILRCVMVNSFNFSLVITHTPKASEKLALAPSRLPGQALAYDGRMRVGPPSLPLHIALDGIANWPKPT